MRLFHKVFLCFAIIFGVTFQIAGYLLLDFSYQNTIEQEKRIALQEFQYNKYILQSILYSEQEILMDDREDISDVIRSFTIPVALYGIDEVKVFSNLSVEQPGLDFQKSEDDRVAYQIYQSEESGYIFVYDYVSHGENGVFLVTETDISQAMVQQKAMATYFQKIYLIILAIGIPIIIVVTGALTNSIKKVSKAAKKIAEGSFSERIAKCGRDEVGELATDFNQMAEKIEEKMFELSEMARQKEDFTANFAHELKTPLTSVIGYADMLYQKELPREQIKEIAGYILSEGMRLEALSLKLMDLFVLDKQKFVLERMAVREMFENMRMGMASICETKGVDVHIRMENGIIDVDYDLFETLVFNLIDNAVKADSKDVWIKGVKDEKGYWIRIKDNGKGIPPEELGRITEAFYMVDKSRARKQHGAGLGMALVSKIVTIHGAKMNILSDGKNGTEIQLLFKQAKGVRNE